MYSSSSDTTNLVLGLDAKPSGDRGEAARPCRGGTR